MTPTSGQMENSRSSLVQAGRIIIVASWVATGLSLLGALTSTQRVEHTLTAAVTSTLFVAIASFLPQIHLTRPNLQLELVILAGVVLTATATTFTGGLDSPFLLVALTPTLLGAIAGGHRLGLTTSLLSSALLVGVAVSASGRQALSSGLGAIALFPLLALVVGQIRVLLVDAEARANRLERASHETELQMARMEQANELLRRLTDVYSEGNSNPVDVGRSAIDAIVDFQPGSFATATLFDTQGPVVIARAGTDSAELIRTQFLLKAGDNTSGVVSLGTHEPLGESERTEVDRLLRPVAISFANAVLLQEIATEAVREERLRLARELHDEIGPAMAALGFSLDALALHSSAPADGEEIASVRSALGNIVEDLRGTIADLRSEESGSLAAAILSAQVDQVDDPPLEIEIYERRPLRRPAARQILAIVLEAIRNAHQHADGTRITVSGTVDRNSAEIKVADDGRGFDPRVIPEGHYGVMGMRERADRIGAVVDIHSSGAGTTVTIRWKER